MHIFFRPDPYDSYENSPIVNPIPNYQFTKLTKRKHLFYCPHKNAGKEGPTNFCIVLIECHFLAIMATNIYLINKI